MEGKIDIDDLSPVTHQLPLERINDGSGLMQHGRVKGYCGAAYGQNTWLAGATRSPSVSTQGLSSTSSDQALRGWRRMST
jgi:hypothetical protein